MKLRRCLKFTAYIYLPTSTEDLNGLRYYASRTPGRLILFDEYGIKETGKPFAFDNLGEMVNVIEKVRRKLVYKRVRRTKK